MAKWNRTNNDLQSIKHTNKDRVTQTRLKTGGELRWSGRASSFCCIILFILHNTSPYIRKHTQKSRIVQHHSVFILIIIAVLLLIPGTGTEINIGLCSTSDESGTMSDISLEHFDKSIDFFKYWYGNERHDKTRNT
jgi:hypothetical protein